MAVDTRNKRSSALLVSLPWRGLLPLPDSSLSQADRQHVAFQYSGIAADPLTVSPLKGHALLGVGR